MEEAERLGVETVLGAKVVQIDVDAGVVTLEGGTVATADVVVGGDGTFLAGP